jgi:fructosamine-3-kinase
VAGGCIHQAHRLRTDCGDFFLKRAPQAEGELLRSEAWGLRELAATGTVRVPGVVGCLTEGDTALLVLEWIDLQPLDGPSGAQLGETLARLHSTRTTPTYGAERDNFIGRTPQPNRPHATWADFFVEERLRPQWERARQDGAPLPESASLLEEAHHLLADHAPPPAPLHGDLWGGNAAADAHGHPVVFDPAHYRGDPETDLAWTKMFGGFPASFYDAYDRHLPPRAGREMRAPLYNLYHMLNHLNLFGRSYLPAVEEGVRSVRAAAR